MSFYNGCNRCKYDNKQPNEYPCIECMHNRGIDHYKPMTNADRIRNMTDEELALFLINAYNGIMVHMKCTSCMDREKACNGCFEKWLKAEVKEGEDNERI